MRDNYVGDVGDFYKYALLRHLSGLTANDASALLCLGIVWYLYPDPCNPNDGNHRPYLEGGSRGQYEALDPDLYAAMAALSDVTLRNVEAVAQQKVLPSTTRFFSEPLSFSGHQRGTMSAMQQRIAHRDAWFARALEVMKGVDLVFADPDNGLEIATVAAHRDRGAKYAFYSDLLPFWNRAQSLVIYQHCDRTGAAHQAAKRKRELLVRLAGAAFVDVIYFPGFGGRMFFVAAQAAHDQLLRARLNSFRARASQHIALI